MSTTTSSATVALSWSVRRRQLVAITQLELRRTALSTRSALAYLLAALPLLAVAVMTISYIFSETPAVGFGAARYANIFATFVLRFVTFIGSLVLFSGLIRREIQDRSLHYYFLAPLRRETVLVGKYAAAAITGMLLFCGATLGSLILLFIPHGVSESMEYIFQGPGLLQIFSYLAIVAFGVLAYGALFMTLGLFLKNPIIPALGLFLLEFANPWLPAVLKKLSIVYYLDSMLPLRTETARLFAVQADPAPIWLAVIVLLALAAGLVALATTRVRAMELSYGTE